MTSLEAHLDRPLREVIPMLQDAILRRTTYRGVPALKCPTDAWVYMELLHELRPRVVIEVGTHAGGGTLFLADIVAAFGGRVIGVDVDHSHVTEIVRLHPSVRLVTGDACKVVDLVQAMLTPLERQGPVLVIEDSSHTYDNTLSVLRAYAPLVTSGSYLIVEDTICHHGLAMGPSPGPFEAAAAFLAENPAFAVDRSREKFVITWNPKGFLKRV